MSAEVFDNLSVTASTDLAKTTTNNTITWQLDVDNAIGEVEYEITVRRGETQVLTQTAYDPSSGISVLADENGEYQLSVSVTDIDGQTAQTVSTVTVSDTITYTENGNVWEYVVTEVQGQLGASVKLDTLANGATHVTIPKTMYGTTVLRIDTEAFIGRTGITSVTVPDTVTEIGARAFKGCTGLTGMSTY